MRNKFQKNSKNYRKSAINELTRSKVRLFYLCYITTSYRRRQIIILLGIVVTRTLVRVDGKSYYEIIINGIMSEVTRYVFE